MLNSLKALGNNTISYSLNFNPITKIDNILRNVFWMHSLVILQYFYVRNDTIK